jgi:hypothetical protein
MMVNRDEVRKILSVYRAGEELFDPLLAAARKDTENDPELAAWFAREQNFDNLFSRAIASGPLPAGLKIRVTPGKTEKINRTSPWRRRFVLAAAAVVVLGVFLSSWRGPFVPNTSLADYRGEMMSFVKLDPPLQLESGNLATINDWLVREGAPSGIELPLGLAALDPLGCRVLTFRGQKVTLLCFCRGTGKPHAYLFVVARGDIEKLPPATAPVFTSEGQWVTASWESADYAYLMAAQGERTLFRHFSSDS